MPVPAERLKVVRIVARLNVGGPARHVTILSRDLAAAGFDTVLVHGSLAHGEASLECPMGDSVRVIQLPELGREVRLFKDLAALFRLVRILFAERPDVVDTHTSKAGAVGRLAAFVYNALRGRRRRCLVVHTFHGHVFRGYFGAVGNRAVRVAERFLARLTDVIITLSPSQQADIVDRYRVARSDKVVVIPIGLDLESLQSIGEDARHARAAIGLGESDMVFGFVGRLVPIKDPGTLLQAFSAVRRDVPSARLIVVGDGELRGSLERLAGSLGLGDSAVFLGWRTDLSTIYSSIQVLVLSSLSEGTPVALIEAMAAGKPVVATAVGGVPDIVADGSSGVLVTPANPAALAEAMTRLAQHPELRRQMGLAGRSRSGDYSASRLVERTGRLYRAGLARKRGLPSPPPR